VAREFVAPSGVGYPLKQKGSSVYRNVTLPSSTGQANHDQGHHPTGTTGKKGWTVRIPDLPTCLSIRPEYLRMLLILEWLCRDKSYCWASNATLASMYGGKLSGGFRKLMANMEADQYLWRLMVNPDKPTDGRAGIFLHKRLNPDFPVEDRPPPPEAVARLWAARKRSSTHASSEAGALPPKRQPPLPLERQQNKDKLPNKDETKNDDGFASSSLLTEAEKRFGGNLAQRLSDAVAIYGDDWVGRAIALPNLRAWGGVQGTL
jgi:hypothetical protein